MKKTLIRIVLLAIVVVIVITVVRNNSQSTQTGPIQIGVVAPLTGDAAVYGEPAKNVYQLAVDEINAAGGINGRPMQLITEDGKCSGEGAANAAQKLVNVDQVQAIIGGFCSGESLAIIPVAEPKQVAVFSPASSNPGLTGKSAFFFRDFPSDSSQGNVLADTAYAQGRKKVAFIQEQTDYASGIYSAFATRFQALGGSVTKEEVPTGAKDLRSQISKIKSVDPDAIFADVQTPALGEVLFQQMSQLGVQKPMILNDVLIGNPTFIAEFKGALEGAIGAEFGVDANNPKYQHLVAAYKAKFGTDVAYPSYAQTEYDAVYLLKDAIASVGYDGAKIARFGHNVKDWQGASGSLTIGADGDRVGGHRAEIIKNGQVLPFSK